MKCHRFSFLLSIMWGVLYPPSVLTEQPGRCSQYPSKQISQKGKNVFVGKEEKKKKGKQFLVLVSHLQLCQPTNYFPCQNKTLTKRQLK